MEVPRRLRELRELDAYRPDHDPRRGLQRAVQRKHLRASGGHDAAARLARRPRDVPARVSQLRRSRVARREPQRRPDRRRRRGPLVRDPKSRRNADRLPAEHVRARHAVPLDGQRGDGPRGGPRGRLQPLERHDEPGDRLHRPDADGSARHPRGRDDPDQCHGFADRRPQALGRLQLDGHRSGG